MPIDVRVLGFAVVLSFVAAIGSGLAPALQASRADLVPALKADTAQSGGRLRLRSAFLVGQIALSLLLVLTAGLFLRALAHAAAMPIGFTPANVDVVMLDFSLARYSETTGPVFGKTLVERARRLPGVQAAALIADLPLDGDRMGFGEIRTPGLRRGDRESFDAYWNVVSPGSFAALEMPLVRGRDFSDADVAGAPRVAIVNEAMARAIWRTPDVLGRRLELNDGASWEPATIVGVAADARVIALEGRVPPYIYVAFAQRYTARTSLIVRSAGAGAIPQLRALVRELNPNQPVSQAMPLREITAIELIPQRIAGTVAASLGLVGLLLAAIGTYGVSSYHVNRRTREIGLRLALGADGGSVLRLVLRQGLTLTAIGIGLGLAAGAAVAVLIRSLLFGVGALDPMTFAGAAALFTAVALAACIGPARRAARVDPMVALRAE